jgi:hypothetical protein
VSKGTLCDDAWMKQRKEGAIFPAINALLGVDSIKKVLDRGHVTLSNFISTVMFHKEDLFAKRYDDLVQRMLSHKGLDLDHLIGVPFGYLGKVDDQGIR